MKLTGTILDKFMNIGLIILVILFQDQVKRFLVDLGSQNKWRAIRRLIFRQEETSEEKVEEEKPTERDLTPLHDFMNSGWKNIYDTLDDKQKRALWRSVINYIDADVPTKEFEIKFI